jgi:hypothetical protein
MKKPLFANPEKDGDKKPSTPAEEPKPETESAIKH